MFRWWLFWKKNVFVQLWRCCYRFVCARAFILSAHVQVLSTRAAVDDILFSFTSAKRTCNCPFNVPSPWVADHLGATGPFLPSTRVRVRPKKTARIQLSTLRQSEHSSRWLRVLWFAASILHNCCLHKYNGWMCSSTWPRVGVNTRIRDKQRVAEVNQLAEKEFK